MTRIERAFDSWTPESGVTLREAVLAAERTEIDLIFRALELAHNAAPPPERFYAVLAPGLNVAIVPGDPA